MFNLSFFRPVLSHCLAISLLTVAGKCIGYISRPSSPGNEYSSNNEIQSAGSTGIHTDYSDTDKDKEGVKNDEDSSQSQKKKKSKDDKERKLRKDKKIDEKENEEESEEDLEQESVAQKKEKKGEQEHSKIEEKIEEEENKEETCHFCKKCFVPGPNSSVLKDEDGDQFSCPSCFGKLECYSCKQAFSPSSSTLSCQISTNPKPLRLGYFCNEKCFNKYLPSKIPT